MNTEPRVPKVGEFVRGVGKLVAVETIQPPPPAPYTDYIFEQIDAKCELWMHTELGDELVKHLSTMGDTFGEGNGVETAIREMLNYADKHNILKDSQLEVRVTRVATQWRKKALKLQPNFYDKTFISFAESDFRQVGDAVETIVWSSRG